MLQMQTRAGSHAAQTTRAYKELQCPACAQTLRIPYSRPGSNGGQLLSHERALRMSRIREVVHSVTVEAAFREALNTRFGAYVLSLTAQEVAMVTLDTRKLLGRPSRFVRELQDTLHATAVSAAMEWIRDCSDHSGERLSLATLLTARLASTGSVVRYWDAITKWMPTHLERLLFPTEQQVNLHRVGFGLALRELSQLLSAPSYTLGDRCTKMRWQPWRKSMTCLHRIYVAGNPEMD